MNDSRETEPTHPHSDVDRKRDVEWELPASEARKQALNLAIDHLVPLREGEAQSRRFYGNGGLEVLLTHYPDDEFKMVELLLEAVSVDSGGEATKRSTVRFEYLLWPLEDDEGGATLLKSDWPGKSADEDREVVSEGEANHLLDQMARLANPSEEPI